MDNNTKFFIWVLVGIASAISVFLSFYLEANIRYLIARLLNHARGRPPGSKPLFAWIIYIFSLLLFVIGTAVVSSAPEPTYSTDISLSTTATPKSEETAIPTQTVEVTATLEGATTPVPITQTDFYTQSGIKITAVGYTIGEGGVMPIGSDLQVSGFYNLPELPTGYLNPFIKILTFFGPETIPTMDREYVTLAEYPIAVGSNFFEVSAKLEDYSKYDYQGRAIVVAWLMVMNTDGTSVLLEEAQYSVP